MTRSVRFVVVGTALVGCGKQVPTSVDDGTGQIEWPDTQPGAQEREREALRRK